ncbi:helix-turn-helix domain-containing protein [Brevundimonas sp. BR2-1]|uniref:helix-turn-helix domain-containing protein n=1 Tax=unclassified Brevundimonas TaxID=2622653 RepID=UPI002FCAA25A
MTLIEPFSDRTSFGPAGANGTWDGALRMDFAPGEEIYGQQESADLIYYLVKGSIRTSHLLTDGRRQVGDFYYEGDVFGVETGPEHRFSAEALTTCDVMVVKRSGSVAFEPGRVEKLLRAATATELARAQTHLLLLGRATACERVARFLLDMADRFRGDLVILPMSRQDMADYLGLTIETVSRMLGRLQADGVVEFAGSRRFRVRHHSGLARLAAA